MTVVIDSGILIAFTLADDPLYTQANQILSAWQSTKTQLIAPRLLRSEITAVLRKAVYQQRITHDQGYRLLLRLLGYPVEVYEDDDLLKAAYELAARFNRPRAYDSQYLALAERYNCEFWTADETLVNAVQGRFTHIRWLGRFSP